MSLENHTTAELFKMINEDLDLLDDGSWVPDSSSIDATRTVLEEIEKRTSAPSVNVILNSFDAEGNQTDTTNMDLSTKQVSDILDHAAQLAIVMRNMAAKQAGIEAFDQVYSGLEEALTTANVISETDAALPALTLTEAAA